MCHAKKIPAALQKLFVCGAMKYGQPNHSILKNPGNGYAKFWCRATTTEKLPLVIATRYNIPFLLNKPGVGNYVSGEIYEVDDKMLSALDNLEDCQDIFKREVHNMNIGIGEGTVPCWVYLLQKYPENLLQKQFLSSYENSTAHPYVQRNHRTYKHPPNEDLTYTTARDLIMSGWWQDKAAQTADLRSSNLTEDILSPTFDIPIICISLENFLHSLQFRKKKIFTLSTTALDLFTLLSMLTQKVLQLVFVYGTLKSGQPNHFWLTKAENGFSRFVARGKTVQKYPLVIGTRYNIPFLLDKPGTGHEVDGEIYEVDSAMFANLDLLEDYPNYYDREVQPIRTDNGILQCWLYMIRRFPEQLLCKKHLESYSSTPEQPYIARSRRDSQIKASEDLAF